MAEDVFSALANPTRRALLGLLLERPRPVRELAGHFDMRRPSVSEHIKVLRDAGLVQVRVDGNQRLYRVDADRLAEVRHQLEGFWGERLGRLASGIAGEAER